MKRHVSKIDMEGMLRAFYRERNFHGIRAVFRAAGAIDVRDYGPAYFVAFPRYGGWRRGWWVEWDNLPRALDALDCLKETVRYMTPTGT